MITEYKTKKVYDYLKERANGRVLFIFDHGLGDLINFLPLYDSLLKLFPSYRFEIGTPISRSNTYLHHSIINIGFNFRSIIRNYTYIFKIRYPEPTIEERNQGLRKPYLCNLMEMGIPNFIWKPYNFNWNINTNGSRLIGFHFTGSTNPRCKNIDFKIIEEMWKEVKDYGYTPFEMHMNCENTLDKNYPIFINERNSLRFYSLDLELLIDNIKECKLFFGIDSGPFYLATAILGTNKCIFLKNMMELNWYFPYPMKIIDTNFYKKGDMKSILQNL